MPIFVLLVSDREVSSVGMDLQIKWQRLSLVSGIHRISITFFASMHLPRTFLLGGPISQVTLPILRVSPLLEMLEPLIGVMMFDVRSGALTPISRGH